MCLLFGRGPYIVIYTFLQLMSCIFAVFPRVDPLRIRVCPLWNENRLPHTCGLFRRTWNWPHRCLGRWVFNFGCGRHCRREHFSSRAWVHWWQEELRQDWCIHNYCCWSPVELVAYNSNCVVVLAKVSQSVTARILRPCTETKAFSRMRIVDVGERCSPCGNTVYSVLGRDGMGAAWRIRLNHSRILCSPGGQEMCSPGQELKTCAVGFKLETPDICSLWN